MIDYTGNKCVWSKAYQMCAGKGLINNYCSSQSIFLYNQICMTYV